VVSYTKSLCASDLVANMEGLVVDEAGKLFVLRLLIQVLEKPIFSFYICTLCVVGSKLCYFSVRHYVVVNMIVIGTCHHQHYFINVEMIFSYCFMANCFDHIMTIHRPTISTKNIYILKL
jgi:hypothetical protein